MAHFNFAIPINKDDLLSETVDYSVRNVVTTKELPDQLKVAKSSLRDEGPEFILNNFDVYFSVLHLSNSLQMCTIFESYKDLHKAAQELNNSLRFLLEDKASINDELKQKYVNIIKMLIYIYTKIVMLIEQKNFDQMKNHDLLRKGKKSMKNELMYNVDKKAVLLTLNNIIQSDIAIFWDPPMVEDNFLSLVTEVCYNFLQNPSIKGEKDVRQEVFNLIGTLITSYNLGELFAIRIVHLLKDEEHMVICLAEGVQQLVKQYNCKGLVHDLVKECTEWQTDERYQDSKGSKYCADLLTSMAVLMPDFMIPELFYLNKYLFHDSANLRNAVLNIISEVIINVLSKHELNEEETESRDDFLNILMDHVNDISAHVRSKVLQHFTRLQQENAIPRKQINEVLELVIEHLDDKAAIVRKGAAKCVTTFLSTNPYSAELSMKNMEEELEANKQKLSLIKTVVDEVTGVKLGTLEEEWNAKLPELEKVVEEELEKEEDSDEEEDNEKELPKSQITELIRMYLSDGKYKEAFQLCKTSGADDKEFTEIREKNQENEKSMYLFLLKSIFINPLKVLGEISHGITQGSIKLTKEDFDKFEFLQAKVSYLSDAMQFLKLIQTALDPMTDLIESATITDMQEAVSFFIAAYQFKLDNVEKGLMVMLNMMKRNLQDRKDIVIQAFKTIYLTTDSSNIQEHCTTVVRRLIIFLESVQNGHLEDLEAIISEWVAKGILDNNIIDMLWQFFTKRSPVSDEDCHASCELLRMAALGRRTIITKNIKLVATIAFGEMGAKNMAFLGTACRLLAVVGIDKIDITSTNPPFRIGSDDNIFKDLFDILLKNFFEPVEFYHDAMWGAIDFVYKVCNKPEKPCEEFIKQIYQKLVKDQSNPKELNLDRFIYMRLCQLLGIVALKQLDYLDETVYKELKRRDNVRSERKKDKKKKSKPSVANKSASGALSLSASVNSSVAANNTTTAAGNETTFLEGAQAEDEDAEFILHVLEQNTVTSAGLLGKLGYLIKNVCENPNTYDDEKLQGTAVTALIRYMLVSSGFCKQHVRLLFTILERTKYESTKVSILVQLSDLLTRFPNIIEPWTPKILERLSDQSIELRRATFLNLASLVLKDMILPHGYLSKMVLCLVDPDEDLNNMCRIFFTSFAQKENNMYCMLPDIFSHLMAATDVSDENIRFIMKFLFDLMDKTKRMENLVDRFCSKFSLTEELRQHRHITYCLTLVTYNDKALRKLQDNFPAYKHLVHDGEIYNYFKTIIQSCSRAVGKANLKAIAVEIEKSINSVFELNKPDQAPPSTPSAKSAKKPKRVKRKKTASNDNDSDDDLIEAVATPQRTAKTRTRVRSRRNQSDSDDESMDGSAFDTPKNKDQQIMPPPSKSAKRPVRKRL